MERRHFAINTASCVIQATISVWLFVLLPPLVFAAEQQTDSVKISERPWATVWISSLARVLAACDIIYDSVDRPDLSDGLENRQTSFRDFQGIDRTRPLGMMWMWDDIAEPASVLFFPIQDIDELMKTVTLNGIVDYHKVNDTQYQIERPGVPYHAIVRSGYLLMGEDVPALNALRSAPERTTRDWKEKYEIVLSVDQRQVSKASKQLWVDAFRKRFEPWLQPQDQEPVESAVIRRALGKALLDLIDQAVHDIQTMTVGIRIDRKTYQLQLDVMLQAEPNSAMAAAMNRLVVKRSEFSALVDKQASAGLAINWPLTVLGNDLPGIKGNDVRGERLDAGVQLIGSDWSDLTIIAGIRGREATALNVTVPHLLTRMEKSAQLKALQRNLATYKKVALHKIVPADVPVFLQSFVRPQYEVIVGQGQDVVWIALGGPETLLERLQAAIDAVEETPAADRSKAVLQGRLSMGKWPGVLPLVDANDAKAALEKAKDGFTMTVQPIPNGLKIQLAAEEGLIRVIGRHWVRQVDDLPPVP